MTPVYIVLIVTALIGDGYGCTCAGGTNKQIFCGSKFVIKGKVVGVDKVNIIRHKYTVDVVKYFKGSQGPYERVDIFAYIQGSMCGVGLQTGKTYLLSGYVKDGNYFTSSCQWISFWIDIPKDTRMSLEKGTFGNC